MGMVQAKAKSVSKNPMIVDDNGAEVDQQIMKIPSEKLNTASIPAPNWASQLPANSPQVFFDIAVNGTVIGRIEMTLAKNIVPKTVANFRTLCLGNESGRSSGKPLQYKGCPFHRIIPNFMCQGGDFTNKNGTGGESIYGKKFADENFKLKHTGPGILSMANAGPGTNGSQFFLCTAEASWLDGKHVVFGYVSKGYEVVQRMETYGSQSGSVSANIIIADCGELSV